MEKIKSRNVDAFITGIEALVSGWLFADVAHSVAKYQAQAESITHKIYSAAQTITPEVAEQANNLIFILTDRSDYFGDYFSAMLGAVNGVVAIAYGVKCANKKNYDE